VWPDELQREAHARRHCEAETDAARVAAAVLATKITHGRVASSFTCSASPVTNSMLIS
jgi:hypothetical protein